MVSSITTLGKHHDSRCFNLAIEILLISSSCVEVASNNPLRSFNLAIEILLISSSCVEVASNNPLRSFDLVIEILLISSTLNFSSSVPTLLFRSRNRGSFDFKCIYNGFDRICYVFRSRNRGSFDFKPAGCYLRQVPCLFRSRNRGAFDFKETITRKPTLRIRSFNLVIEVLLISSRTRYRNSLRYSYVSIS